MTTLLLRVGDPAVRYSPLSRCWLVDDGSMVPQRIEDRRTAYEVAATFVPPVGEVVREEPARDFATPGVAGTSRSRLAAEAEAGTGAAAVPSAPAAGPHRHGQASESAVVSPPENVGGSDVFNDSGPAGFVGTAGPDPQAVSS